MPPGLFTRGVAKIVRGIGFGLGLVRWLFWALLWLPTQFFQRLYGAVAAIYPALLRWSLRHRPTVIFLALLIFAGAMSLVPRLGTELIPQLSQGEFNVDLRLPPGAPLSETDRAIQAAQRATVDIDIVALDYSVAGTGNRLDANPVDAGDNTGTLSIALAPGAGRNDESATMDAMRRELARIPGVQYEFSRPSLMTFASPLQIEIAGYDLEGLALVNQAIVTEMAADDRFADIRTTIERGNPEIQIVFDQERAAKLGLAVRDIADRVVANVRGELATRYTWRDRKIDVLVRSVDTRRSSVDEIRQLIVNPASDRPVTSPMSASLRDPRRFAVLHRSAWP
jgi:HAE1 family hydrophobic/amphiphilic exporter-1